MADKSYQVIDGVRRAKAAFLCGRLEIPAQIDQQGALSEVFNVPLADLYSPHKGEIDISTQPLLDRWLAVLQAASVGQTPRPIIVRSGSGGVRIPNVGFKH